MTPRISVFDVVPCAVSITAVPTICLWVDAAGHLYSSIDPEWVSVSDADLSAAYAGCEQMAERYATAFTDPANVGCVLVFDRHRRRIEMELAIRAAYDERGFSVYYMHDDHTFTKLTGTVEEMVTDARIFGFESPYGMLGPARINDRDKKELLRIHESGIHARKGFDELELIRWGTALMDFATRRQTQRGR